MVQSEPPVVEAATPSAIKWDTALPLWQREKIQVLQPLGHQGEAMIWDVERGEIQEKLAEVAKQLEEMRAYL